MLQEEKGGLLHIIYMGRSKHGTYIPLFLRMNVIDIYYRG